MEDTDSTCLGLIVMYLAGWVHRDISGGNILWYDDKTGNSRGILSDLEYAKKDTSDGGCSDPKTVILFSLPVDELAYLTHKQQGTAFYMAHEITKGVTLAEPPRDEGHWQETMPLRHNFLHDVESVWWLHLWTMLDRVPHEPSQKLARHIFVNGPPTLTREAVFITPGKLFEVLRTLHPTLSTMATASDATRRTLHYSYRDFKNPVDPECYGKAYDAILCLLQAGIDLEHDVVDLILYPRPVEVTTASRKRTAFAEPGASHVDNINPRKKARARKN